MYRESVHLTRDGKSKQWRIDSLPPGVVMGKSDFQRNYMSVNRYYFASNTPVRAAAETGPVREAGGRRRSRLRAAGRWTR